MLQTDIQTYRQTDIQTDRPSDEAGPRGAFAPKNNLNLLNNNLNYFFASASYDINP